MTVYEFEDRRFLRKFRELRLCSGETVAYVDDDSFEVTNNGERLTRVKP